MNDKIVLSAAKVVSGDLKVETKPYFCLKVVRQIVEDANGWTSGEFYERYWTDTVEENKTNEPWARDIERSLRNQGKVVVRDEAIAGDLVFNYFKAPPYGHVGVLISDNLVLENTPSNRGLKRGNITISTLEEFAPTTIIRL